MYTTLRLKQFLKHKTNSIYLLAPFLSHFSQYSLSRQQRFTRKRTRTEREKIVAFSQNQYQQFLISKYKLKNRNYLNQESLRNN